MSIPNLGRKYYKYGIFKVVYFHGYGGFNFAWSETVVHICTELLQLYVIFIFGYSIEF